MIVCAYVFNIVHEIKCFIVQLLSNLKDKVGRLPEEMAYQVKPLYTQTLRDLKPLCIQAMFLLDKN